MTPRFVFTRAALAATVVAVAAAAVGTALATTGPQPNYLVNVTITDTKFVVNKGGVSHQTYVDFLVRNRGKVPHNFVIGGLTTGVLKPGQTVHLLVGFPVVGHYTYRSTLNPKPTLKGVFKVEYPLPPE
jgi:hypothetical protein